MGREIFVTRISNIITAKWASPFHCAIIVASLSAHYTNRLPILHIYLSASLRSFWSLTFTHALLTIQWHWQQPTTQADALHADGVRSALVVALLFSSLREPAWSEEWRKKIAENRRENRCTHSPSSFTVRYFVCVCAFCPCAIPNKMERQFFAFQFWVFHMPNAEPKRVGAQKVKCA